MKTLILTSILVLTSLISFSQTKIVFSNSSVTLYTASENKNIDENLLDPSTTYAKPIDSYGVYTLDLNKKTLTLNFNGGDETFYIKESKIINNVLYVKTLTMDKDKNTESNYRINLNPKSENDDFVNQHYYSNLGMTYGIISQIKIISLQ